MQSWLEKFEIGDNQKKSLTSKGRSELRGKVYFLGKNEGNWIAQIIQKEALIWQRDSLHSQDREFVYFVGQNGPVWIIRPQIKRSEWVLGRFDDSDYSWARDTVGALLPQFKAHQLGSVAIEFRATNAMQDLGAFVGFDLAAYNFRSVEDKKKIDFPKVNFKKTMGRLDPQILQKSQARAFAVNWARHLVNLSPNELNPQSFVAEIKKRKWSLATKLEVWDEKRLKKEKMGLHLAVGQAAEHGPKMVHLKYRPKMKTKSKLKPIAFVGKGITFDTGGLDLKPSSGMRLMKKDMGGAAAVLALALWVDQTKYAAPCDFYLALAENVMDAKSVRPSDVVVARNGLKVEIDNTDAEGRLVLADVIDVALTQKPQDDPEILIDVATLTGAIKVALGSEVAGLFSNDNELATTLNQCGWLSGDWNWQMPLVDKYANALSSNFADCKNSADGFGSAITAALFLKKFIRGKKWAHLDIYSWTDKGQGPISGGAGNGQAVQCLIEFLQNRCQR
ncbi:MAG: leucyl aminopeptidase family protein [Bdellovibrionota bacterium]